MTNKTTCFVVSDFLTLFAASDQYPDAFVGIGPHPTRFYYLPKVLTDDSVMSVLRGDLKQAKAGFLVLFPSADTLCGIQHDMAEPACACCYTARPLSSHKHKSKKP